MFCGMSKSKKRAVLESFETDNNIRVMCGVKSVVSLGLNLQKISSTVVLCEPGWNDSIDAQAIARVDRHGQRRIPHIYRLLISGSVDIAVRKLQQTKRTIANSALYRREDVQLARVLRNMIDLNPATALVKPAPGFAVTYDQGFLPGELQHLPSSCLEEELEPVKTKADKINDYVNGGVQQTRTYQRALDQRLDALDNIDQRAALADLSADELAYNQYFFKSLAEIAAENKDFV